MLRLSLALLGVVGLLTAFAEPASAPSPGPLRGAAAQPLASPARILSDAGCKPTAPIDLSVIVPEGARAGLVPMDFEITSRVDVERLSWELVLSPNVLVEGETRGELDVVRDVPALGQTTINLPYDGLDHTVGLRVTAVIEGSDETGSTFPETVAVERVVVFGEPSTNAVPVLTRDGESSELVTVWAVPSSHKVGR